MATTTANTKTITRTRVWPAAFALIGAALLFFATANLLGSLTPYARLNDQIVDGLAHVSALPSDQRLQMLVWLREQQKDSLAGLPAEPFGWMRLAYLRYVTQGDMRDAFAALRMADQVSPEDSHQLPERALMWRQFAAAENSDQLAYQATLWQKAYRMQRELTWQLAKQHGLTAEVGDALQQGDPELYEEWKTREQNDH